jgi:hypothetical protein
MRRSSHSALTGLGGCFRTGVSSEEWEGVFDMVERQKETRGHGQMPVKEPRVGYLITFDRPPAAGYGPWSEKRSESIFTIYLLCVHRLRRIPTRWPIEAFQALSQRKLTHPYFLFPEGEKVLNKFSAPTAMQIFLENLCPGETG